MTRTEILVQVIHEAPKQAHVFAPYAEAVKRADGIDFGRVNRAILDRWSMAGLERIKEAAWGIYESRPAVNLMQTIEPWEAT